MAEEQDSLFQCLIDHAEYDFADGAFLHELNPETKKSILADHPKASDQSFICSEHLVKYLLEKLDKMIKEDKKKDKQIHQKMRRVLYNHNYKIIDIGKKLENTYTLGQKIADSVAHFGGSWPFVIPFVAIMLGWIIINMTHVFGANFDPFPFILLNLFLLMVAAIQGP